MAVELTYAGSAGKHLVFCYNPNEVQPGIGSQESRRLIQPLNRLNNMLQCDPRNRSTYHSGQLKVTQRFSGGAAVPRQLHLRQVARLRRLGGERRRRGRQPADGHQPRGRPRPVRLRRAPSRRHQRRLGAAVGTGPPLAARGRRARRDRRRLAVRRHRRRSPPAGRSPCSCRPASTTARRAGRTASARASWTIRRSISGTTRATSSRRRRTPTATAAAASSTGPGT